MFPIRKLMKNTRASGASMTTHLSGLPNSVWPNDVRPTMVPASLVTTDAWKVNHATFVLGPTGVALGANDTLYVAQTLGSHITAIPNASTRTSPVVDGTSTLTSGGSLNAPLGMALAPNGNLIVTNGNDGNAVEITPKGVQIAKATLVPNGAGALFGVTPSADGRGLVFVNDSTNAVSSDLPANSG